MTNFEIHSLSRLAVLKSGDNVGVRFNECLGNLTGRALEVGLAIKNNDLKDKTAASFLLGVEVIK